MYYNKLRDWLRSMEKMFDIILVFHNGALFFSAITDGSIRKAV